MKFSYLIFNIFSPFFSFDVRGRPLNDAQHWSAPETFGSRARFNADVDPATLDIKVGISSLASGVRFNGMAQRDKNICFREHFHFAVRG